MSVTLKQLESLSRKQKNKVLKIFNRRGYIENLGVKESRELNEQCMMLAHSGMGNMEDRKKAGEISLEFDKWLDDL